MLKTLKISMVEEILSEFHSMLKITPPLAKVVVHPSTLGNALMS